MWDAYYEGRIAREVDSPLMACPYIGHPLKDAWEQGWIDEHAARSGAILYQIGAFGW